MRLLLTLVCVCACGARGGGDIILQKHDIKAIFMLSSQLLLRCLSVCYFCGAGMEFTTFHRLGKLSDIAARGFKFISAGG